MAQVKKLPPENGEPSKVGRPPQYRPEYAEQARKLCARGLIEDEIADVLGVTRQTLWTWKNKYPEFLDAIRAGKAAADDRVEYSLYQSALGYKIETEKVFCNAKGAVTRVPTTEYIPPVTKAQLFWLMNRRPDLWRDRHEYEHRVEYADLTDEELDARLLKEFSILFPGIVPPKMLTIEHDPDEPTGVAPRKKKNGA